MSNTSVDVVVTSPPYNIGVSYRSYDDNRPWINYLTWLREIGHELRRVLKPGGSFFLNVGATSVNQWITFDALFAFKDDFIIQNTIAWIKSIAIGDDTVGHFKPLNSPRFLNNCHETIFHFTHSGDVNIDRLAIGVPFKDKSNIARRGHAQDLRCRGNTWFIPYRTVQSKAGKWEHPAGFPVELPARCIKLHGVKPDLVVLDPFVGTGTSLIAAESLGCRGIGIELDRVYAETAVQRLMAVGPAVVAGAEPVVDAAAA
jgi:site-specific DNA-methyltransferase (adenine-specific)